MKKLCTKLYTPNCRQFIKIYFFSRNLKGGLLCLVDELMSVFIMAFSALIQQEIELSQRVSEEEWDEIRPSKIDRRQSMVSFIKVK